MLRGPGGLEPLLFGSGQDGAIEFSIDGTVLSADIYAESVVLSGLILSNGFRIFARDTISIEGTGGILASGQDAVDENSVNGGAGVIISGGGNSGGGSVGPSDGDDGDSGAVGLGGNGGGAGDTASNAGGAGGTVGDPLGTQYNFLFPLTAGLVWDGTSPLGIKAFGGGGGGGGAGKGSGAGGGGGGGGAGIILAAPEITIDGGAIYSNGGNGFDGVAIGAGNEGGGGGGGGGGWVALMYGKLNIINSGVILVNGGNGAVGAGVGGTNGLGGNGGQIIHFTNGYLASRVEFGLPGVSP